MSFIDLMSNDHWTAADIQRRTEFIIRSDFSLEDETILNRKALGMALGTYELTESEAYELQRYTAVAENARIEYNSAFADMNLLNQVFKIEEAKKIQKLTPLDEAIEFLETEVPEEILDEEGTITNQKEITTYNENLNKAQQTISLYGSNIEAYQDALNKANITVENATEEEINLYNLRNKVDV